MSRGGEIGLSTFVVWLAVFVCAVVITVRGRVVGCGNPTPIKGEGFTTLTGAEGCDTGMTGLNPDGAGWKTVGIVPLARDIIGVVGTGNATLNRGRESGTPTGKLAGGERLSGEALGGVRGA